MVIAVKAGGKSVFNFSTLAGLLEVDAKRYTVQVDKGVATSDQANKNYLY